MTHMDNTAFKFNVMQTVMVSTDKMLSPARVIARYYEDGIPSYKVRFHDGFTLIFWEHELIQIFRTVDDTH